MRKRVCLGAFAGAHGLKGEAKVKTFTETEDGVAHYGPVESEDGQRRFTLKFIRVLKPGLALVAAPEIAGRDDAEALAGALLYVEREVLPAADENEFYIEDLVGLAARDEAGAPLGKIVAVHNFGAGDVIEIAAPGAKAVLVPFTKEAVLAVELGIGVVTVAAAVAAGGEEAVHPTAATPDKIG